MDVQPQRRRLELKLKGAARARGLRRCDDRLFEPVPGSPWAYRESCTCDDFVRHTLRGDEDYRSDPRLPRALGRYLMESDEALPMLARDESILSFSNGVYVLAEDRFVPYECDDIMGASGPVACHHIAAPFTGSTDAPLFESLLAPQFEADDERKEMLCALVGRLLFRRQSARDGWQLTPLLVGRGGSGKSTMLRLAGAMVAPRDVRTAVAADAVRVTANSVGGWTQPTIAAANELVGDADAGLEVFHFNRAPDTDAVSTSLGDRIIANELPAVVARCVRAYLRQRGRMPLI